MKRAVLFVSLALLLLFTSQALAQATADLHVTVKDPKAAAVTNATVTVSDPARGIERKVTNNESGQYLVLQLPPGTYTVTIEAPGFAKTTAVGVNITVGQVAELPVALKIAERTEAIEVNAQTEQIETQRSSVATTIDQQRIDNLPINGRNYVNFAQTNSQVLRDTTPSIGIAPTSGLNIGGQRARSNLVNVDGADAVDNSVNGIRSTVSQEAVQEFQVLTNGYAAEYGRAAGGVVNIITRSGTNQTHGDVFGYLRNRNIQAVNPFSNVPDPAYTRVQAGATLGGPIKKDKTYYFFSYETTRRRETGFSDIGHDGFGLVQLAPAFGDIMVTPEQQTFILANLANPAINNYIAALGAASGMAVNGQWPAALDGLFGLPAGYNGFFSICNPLTPGFPVCAPVPTDYVPLANTTGNYPVKEETSLIALRLDHRFTDRNSAMVRVNVSPSTIKGIGVQGQNQNFGQNAYSRTAIQQYRDFALTAQDTATLGNNKINEARFQFARRGLLFNYNTDTPDGAKVAVNIPGYAFFGREPYSYTRREELRYQWTDNFTWTKGSHVIKFGADVNHLPLTADFTVNFGGVYDFGSVSSQFLSAGFAGFPAFSPVQAYGLGLPQDSIQGVGDPKDQFQNNTLGLFLQDSWRISPGLTLNYGVRYDVEFTPTFAPRNAAVTLPAQTFLNTIEGIPHDTNNIAPRIGLAWDPWKNGKTVIRASYGMFYDHPLLGIAFISDVADGTQAPQLGFALQRPGTDCAALNAPSIFMGILGIGVGGCPGFGYLPNQQRFDSTTPDGAPIFINQNYLALPSPATPTPLSVLPFGYAEDRNFQYAVAHQASLGVERDLGHDFALAVTYNFNGGRHLYHPVDANPVNSEALIINWRRALQAGDPSAMLGNPNAVGALPGTGCGFAGPGLTNPYVPAAVVSFFRPSGLNPSLAPYVPAPCMLGPIAAAAAEFNLNTTTTVPYADIYAQKSNGSSVYHGLTVNLKKRFSGHYEFLASYTWSHAIDDSVDLQSPLQPQDARDPAADRSISLFDQRHRFVFSGVYQSGRLSGEGFVHKFFSDWTVAPIIEVGSGRPFNIITAVDSNFDLQSKTDRPMIVTTGTAANPVCQNTPVDSPYLPSGFQLQAPCFANLTEAAILGGILPPAAEDLTAPLPPLVGNLPRNFGIRPYTLFTDLRIAKRIRITERVGLDAMVDMFNLINKYNVADVNPLYNAPAGSPSAAFDPRQFQFGLKLTF
ncbi:MAG TPA: TonB-dependent receptor [Terriglobales bacterium]|nr:TonB-dependent receptor [Terriglobales bacterium]